MIKNSQFVIRKVSIFITVFLALLLDAQAYTVPEIDSLQSEGFDKLLRAGEVKKAFILEQNAINSSRKLHYDKGEVMGYLNMSIMITGMERYEESMRFLEMADKKLKRIKDDDLNTVLYHLYGRNYCLLGLYQQAIDNFNKSLQYVVKLRDKKVKASRMYDTYNWKRSCFMGLNMIDSVYSYERKCMQSPAPILYIDIAERHLKAGDVDSAEYYIYKANDLTKKVEYEEGKANVLRALGELYIAKNENEKALDYLFRSLAIAKKMDYKTRTLEAYNYIAKAYKNMNDIEKENEYLIKYVTLSDSITYIKKSNLNIPVEKFLKEQEESEEKHKKNLYYLITWIFLAGITAITFFLVQNKRKQKQKNRLILQKEWENNTIKRKLDTVSEKIVQLAIKGDPSFFKTFKEAYPEFYNHLISEYPHLTMKDAEFCAMVKLGFSNKEIAQYSNISIHTVESRKYRLRKKMGLSEDANFNKWIMGLG